MSEEINLSENTRRILEAYTYALQTHAYALACHAECLGMNAENTMACILGKSIPYSDDSYLIALKKWGLTNEEGNPII